MCVFSGGRRNAYRGLVGKPKGKNPVGMLKSRWEGNIEFDLQVMWSMR